jgi:hypothetical protein
VKYFIIGRVISQGLPREIFYNRKSYFTGFTP